MVHASEHSGSDTRHPPRVTFEACSVRCLLEPAVTQMRLRTRDAVVGDTACPRFMSSRCAIITRQRSEGTVSLLKALLQRCTVALSTTLHCGSGARVAPAKDVNGPRETRPCLRQAMPHKSLLTGPATQAASTRRAESSTHVGTAQPSATVEPCTHASRCWLSSASSALR